MYVVCPSPPICFHNSNQFIATNSNCSIITGLFLYILFICNIKSLQIFSGSKIDKSNWNHKSKDYRLIHYNIKFYSNFYDNYEIHKYNIEKANDNQLLFIITNNREDKNQHELKKNRN